TTAAREGTRMEMVYFLIAGIVLYFVSDWILDRIEAAAGRRFENRTVIFFGILLGLALVSFWLIRLATG
ncbi:MAG: hypothetical protein K8F57_03920, partial [Alphaproteobacteria bacterium]|nr:hypothetical protein [Alphaproteobacteria bacterium]